MTTLRRLLFSQQPPLQARPGFRPISVANEFLIARPHGVERVALHLLVHLAEGWHLGLTGRRLLDERPTLSTQGPEFPSLRNVFQFKTGAIRGPQGAGPFGEPPSRLPDEATFGRRLISWVSRRHAGLDTLQLVDLVFAPDTPWRKAVVKGKFGTAVSAAKDRAYFTALARAEGVTTDVLGA